MNKNNPILDEIHRIREEMANQAKGDLHRILEQARERALRSGRAIEPHEFASDKNASASPLPPVPNHSVSSLK